VNDADIDPEDDGEASGLAEVDGQLDGDRERVALFVATSEADAEPLAQMVDDDEDVIVPDALAETDELVESVEELEGGEE